MRAWQLTLDTVGPLFETYWTLHILHAQRIFFCSHLSKKKINILNPEKLMPVNAEFFVRSSSPMPRSVSMRVWWIRTHEQLFRMLREEHSDDVIEHVCRTLRVFSHMNYTHKMFAAYVRHICLTMIRYKRNQTICGSLLAIMYRLVATYPKCLRIIVPDLLCELNYGEYDGKVMPLVVITVMFDYDADDTQQLLERHRLSLAIAIRNSLKRRGPYEMVLFLLRMLLQAGHRDAVVSANLTAMLFSALDDLPPTFGILRELFFIGQLFRACNCPSWDIAQQKVLRDGPSALHRECAICMEETARKPVALNCGHTYCRQCLQKLVESRVQGCMSCMQEHPPSCPQCRKVITGKDIIRIM